MTKGTHIKNGINYSGGGGDGNKVWYGTSEELEQHKDEIANETLIVTNDGFSVKYIDMTPVGNIISYMGTRAPQNYLKCDGSTYRIVDYSSLAEHINEQFGSYNFFGGDGEETFAVPDLRGEFLRGTGTNSHGNNGDGDNIGVHQDATQIPYLMIDKSGQTYCNSGYGGQIAATNIDKTIMGSTNGFTQNCSVGTWTGGGQIKYTSRPTNTSVLYCIKYKNDISDKGTFQSEVIYDNTERIIGTWFDKPLYRRSFITSAITNANFIISLDVNASNLSIHNCQGAFILSSGNCLPFYSRPTNNEYKAIISGYGVDSSHGLYVEGELGTSRVGANIHLEITLEYTKTTD